MSEAAPVGMADFEMQVLEASLRTPVLVDFWAPWCGPCRALAPVLERIGERHAGRLRLAKVNTDEEPELAELYQIRGIPAVKLFRDGVVVAEFVGAQPESAVEALLAPHLPRASAEAHAAALALARAGDAAAARAALEAVHEADPGNLAATLDLARARALAGEVAAAAALLDELPPAAQSDAAVRAARAFVHFAAIAASAAAGPRGLAAELLLGGRPREALEAWFEAMSRDRQAARGELREDVLRAFELLGDDPLVGEFRRRLAALLH